MSDTETVICCIIVSNPAGGTRPRGWQKRVNDHIRSLAKMAALQPDAAVLQEEAEIDALRLKAFWTNAAADRDAYFAAVSVWFQNRHGRALPAAQPDPREAALRDIARQKKTDEMDTEYDVEYADFEGGYNAIIDVARVALRAVQPDLTDPVVVHANMLRGTIAKPTLDQIIHLYGVDALCRALVPAISREAALDEMTRLGQEFDAALKGESHD